MNQKEDLKSDGNDSTHDETWLELESLGVDNDALGVIINNGLDIAHEGVSLLVAAVHLLLACYFPCLDEEHDEFEKRGNLIFIAERLPYLELLV